MELQKQVCSLELAKKLKELGVKQESLFYWDEGSALGDIRLWRIGDVISWGMEESYDEPSPRAISALTVAELGEMLPSSVWSGKNTRIGDLALFTYGEEKQDKWGIGYVHGT